MHASATFIRPQLAWGLALVALAVFATALFIFVTQRSGFWGLHSPQAWAPWLQRWPTALRGSWPSFAHTYAVLLLGCLWLARSAHQCVAMGLLLVAVDVALELLQHPALHAAAHTPAVVRRLFVSTFDGHDLVAIALGAAAAALSLGWARHQTLKGRQ